MRVLTVSDRVEPVLYDRFDAGRFTGIDLILSCGDLPPEYLAFLRAALDAPLFYVRGNHDIRYEASPPTGCESLAGRLVRFQSLTLLGLEGSRWYNGGPNQFTENQMGKKIRSLRLQIWRQRRIDVVITHAPPRHVHDAEDLCHRGFKSFRKLIDRNAPRYFIHGHIHANFPDPGARVTLVNQTRVINTFGHHIIEIDHG